MYATGSGGGCEEYWYLTVPDAAPYSCKADDGPYREVQIKVDGQLAGIAAPFPTVWTGGWSNPFLWYVIPGPRAFDVKPIEYDLTPFAGLLNDGRPHRIDVSVVGVPEGQSGWSTPVNVLVWQDARSEHVTGALTGHKASDAGQLLDVHARFGRAPPRHRGRAPADGRRVREHLARPRDDHRHPRRCANTSVHRWTDGENTDALKATWTDDETVTVDGAGRPRRPVRTAPTRWTATTTLGADDRLRTVLDARRPGGGRRDARRPAHRVVTARRHATRATPRTRRTCRATSGTRSARPASATGCTARTAATTGRWPPCRGR